MPVPVAELADLDTPPKCVGSIPTIAYGDFQVLDRYTQGKPLLKRFATFAVFQYTQGRIKVRMLPARPKTRRTMDTISSAMI
jgi:hypothetical protein